jgi:hypothetical protein
MISRNDSLCERQSIDFDFVTSALDPIAQSPSESMQNLGHKTSETLLCAIESKVKKPLVTSQLPFFIVIGSLFFGTFLVALDATIIGTAIPAITTEYHSLGDIGWYGSGYLLTLTALQPTFGRLYAIWNTKTIYIACVLVFEGKTPRASSFCARLPDG